MNSLIEPLAHVEALLVTGALVAAFSPFIVAVETDESISRYARISCASFGYTAIIVALLAVISALLYVLSICSFFVTSSFALLMLSVLMVFLAFVITASDTVPAIWMREYYKQFTDMQARDLQRVKKVRPRRPKRRGGS